MGMVAALAFLMMVSLAVSSALNVLISHAPAGLQLNRLWPLVSFAISVAVFALLFATIFRYLPDVEIEWRDVWLGSGVTALLFALGKELVGYYPWAGAASARPMAPRARWSRSWSGCTSRRSSCSWAPSSRR